MAAPEIRLSVGLDLEFFRGQMRKAVVIAQSEFTAQLAVKIDRSKLDTELNNLQRSLKRRSYRIELKSNFKAEAEFAERIAATVPALEKAAAAFSQLRKGTGGGSAAAATAIQDQLSLQARLARELSRKGGKGGGYSAAAISRMYDDASRKGLTGITKNPTNRTERSKELSVAFASAGKNAANSFIDAFQADINKGAAAGEELGKATYEGLKRQMQIASPSKKMKKLGEESSEGFVIGLNEGLDDIEKYAQKVKSILDGVAKSIATTGKTIGNIQGKRLGLGNIPLMSRSLEGRGERSSAAIGGVSSLGTLRALQPGINKTITSLVALRAQVDQNTSKLSGFGLIIGLAAFAGVPLAKSIVSLTGSANNFATLLDGLGLKLESAVLKAASNILSASSSRLLSGGGLAGLLPPAYRGINPAAGPAGLLGSGAGPAGLLPPAYRGIEPSRNAGALPPACRGLPFGFDFNGMRPSAGDGGGKPALSSEAMTRVVNQILQESLKTVQVQVRDILSKGQLSLPSGKSGGALEGVIRMMSEQAKVNQAKINKSIDNLILSIDAASRGAKAVAKAMARIDRVQIGELGQIARSQPLLRAGTSPKMLRAGVGREAQGYATGAIGGESRQAMMDRRTTEAYIRSAFRSMTAASHFTQRQRLPGTVFAGDEFTTGGGRDRVRGVGEPPARGGAIVRHQQPQLGPATKLSSDYYKNATKYAEALKIAEASSRNFSKSQFPLIGGINGLAGEFGLAAKQVLLYGTAYKGLAFITSLPGQVLNAAKSQQQFTNGLQTATQSTGTFAKELLYVDNIQRAFGLNLEITRTGFTKLFASMAPTGFDSGSIEKLFTGISAATASLQLTPDKAERVIYAFGQMASKGQIMSEELKGQLGDVLPGALSLFADAAGMSVKKFSEAMEAGEFVGSRFRQVFAKVSDELMNRFGTGAQSAAKSLQGLINVVGGDFQRTLESFAPLANAAAESILRPLGGAFRQLSVAAKLATGEKGRLGGQVTKQEELVKDLGAEASLGGPGVGKIKAQYEGAKLSLEALKIQLENFNELAKDPAVVEQAKNIKAFTDEVGKAASFVKNFALSIGGFLSPILTFLGTNLTAVIGTITSLTLAFLGARLGLLAFAGVMTVIKGVTVAIGFLALIRQVGSFGAALATSGTIGKTVAAIYTSLGISAEVGAKGIVLATGATISFRAAIIALLATTGIGVLIAIIGSVGAAFMAMGQDARQAAEDAKQAAKDMAEAARTGNVFQVEANLRGASADVQLIEDAQNIVRQRSKNKGIGRGATPTLSGGDLSEEEKNTLAAIGISLPERGATQRSLLKQLNDLLAERRSILRKGKSQLDIANKQRERTGQGIPDLGLKGTELPEDSDTEKAAQRGATLLNAIEQREEAIADARKQREESIASIRKNAAEEFMRMEQALADRRIKIEREIIAVKQKSTDTLEDIQRQTRIARGENVDIVGTEQKIADIQREERDTNLEITQRIADEEKEQARNIADFQKKVAKDIQGANEAHAKRIGEIQQGYARQVAKIIADGTGKAAKRLTTAAELAAVYIQRSYSFSPVTGSSFPMPVEARGTTPVYEEGTTVPRSIERLDQKRLDLEQKLIKQLTSSKSSGVGEQFTALLGAEGGFEDIAGLEPLPWLKMVKQMGRPLTKIYQDIERASQEIWSYSRRDIKKMLAPDPKRSQAIIDKAEKFEAVRQDWNPLEAELHQKFNQINPNPRSKPSQASLATFEGVVRDLSGSVFKKLNKMPATIYGILGDVSDYLEEGQKEILRQGIAEQLQQGVDPSLMPVGGNKNTGRVNLRQAVKDITAEILGNEKITPRGSAPTRPLTPLGGDSEWIQRFMEQPSIVPGVQNRIEGASLPGAGFDVSKVATDFGTIAAASILRGVLDISGVPGVTGGTPIAQAYKVGEQVGYDQPQEPIRRLGSEVQAASRAKADARLGLVYDQIVEDSVKASGELTKQIDLIKKQAAAIKSGINSELANEFVQLDANYEKELLIIKAQKLSVIEKTKLTNKAKELSDALKAQTEERLLQSKILEGTVAVDKIKEEIKLLRIIGDDERRLAELRKQYGAEEGQKMFDLQKIKENIEATRALIGDFVSSTTSDYKGFLKAVISGEDAADALKQFQDGLKDKVLTIFLDFAMAPVEKFLKEGLEGLLLPKAVKQKAGELPKEIAKDPVEATNRNTDVTALNTVALESIAAALAGASSTTGGVVGSPEEKTKDELDKMAKDTGKAADDAKDNGEKFKESLGKVTAGIGIAAGSIMGIMAGMSQIKKGGTGNTLMGIGSILASVGGGIGGFMKLAGANGGTAAGGWKPFPARAFANGGMVKGPTLGLVGEGKYNEAIVPLPDGRSIPVQMRGGPGGGSSRDLLASQSQSRSSPSVLSMSFQSTTINGVEYVDRAQLEMAMAETRRVASRDGAARGANLAIDRLANSPSSRRRAGIR